MLVNVILVHVFPCILLVVVMTGDCVGVVREKSDAGGESWVSGVSKGCSGVMIVYVMLVGVYTNSDGRREALQMCW